MTNFYRHNKICCISDIHLGVHQNSTEWHRIIMEWAHWLRDELITKGIQDIQISGDLFHYRNEISVDTMHHAANVLGVWDDFNIVILVGNHDAYYKDTSEIHSLELISKWPNVTVFSTCEQIHSHGKSIAQVPWGVKCKDIPKSDIIFGHFELKYFKMGTHQLCDHGTHPQELAERTNDLVITGHFHLRDLKEVDGKRILYTGSPYQMDLGDADSTKGYYILDIETGQLDFTENTLSPQYKKVKLSWLVERKGMTAAVKKSVINKFVRLYVDLKINNDDLAFITTRLNQLSPASIDIEYVFDERMSMNDNIDALQGVNVQDILVEYIDMLDLSNKPQLKSYLGELYNKCSK